MSRKKHSISSLYHTSGKKSREKTQKVDSGLKTVENFENPVEKVEKNVDKTDTNGGKLVEKNHKTVDKSKDTCVKPVQKHTKNGGKVAAEDLQNVALARASQTPKTVIKVTDLYKSFRLPTERASGLKQAILNWFKGIKGYTEHQVLKGVSFDVHDGEFIGIVGRNGSGKSTLLKLLAQIYFPEKGNIEVEGTIVPFIELGVGFNPELTGRENVYLNGALLGFSRKEMDAMYDEIVHFAELEQFMDAKLKNYSSGMQVRLAFSIAIRARGDILILDEVLAVGDAEFQKKCNDYFASLHGAQTVILVTHSMDNVRKFCDRAILIEDGRVAAEGEPEEVAKAYEKLWG